MTYDEYFNMGSYVVDTTIDPTGAPIKLNKSYSEIAIMPVECIQATDHLKKYDNTQKVYIQSEPEPAPMEEVQWEDAYPKTMKPVESSDEFVLPVDLESPNISTDEIPVIATEMSTKPAIIDEPVVFGNSGEVVEEPIVEDKLPVEIKEEPTVTEDTPVVKKRNTKRNTKKK